jgi:hypothetical protein
LNVFGAFLGKSPTGSISAAADISSPVVMMGGD